MTQTKAQLIDGKSAEIEFTGGSVSAPAISFAGDTNTGIYSPGADQVAISTNGTAAVTVDSSQRVGVGTTSPQQPLHIKNGGSSACRLLLENNGSSAVDATQVWSQNNDLVFNAGSNERTRIDTSGRLLVGTSSTSEGSRAVFQGWSGDANGSAILKFALGTATPATDQYLAYFDFTDSGHLPGARFGAQRDGGTWSASSKPSRLVFSTTTDGASSPTERMWIDNGGTLRTFCNNLSSSILIANATAAGSTYPFLEGKYSATNITTGTTSFKVTTNGNVTNTNNSYGPLVSDERLKQDIIDVGSQWDDIKAVRLTKFRFKNDPTGELQLGPIAQELEQVSPGLITRRPASEDEIADPSNSLVDGDEVLSFKASVLYMKAVGALQEAMERIEQLEAEMAEVKAQLS